MIGEVILRVAGGGRPEDPCPVRREDRVPDRLIDPVVADHLAHVLVLAGDELGAFVVAAPESDAGVVAQALHLMDHLLPDECKEVVAVRVDGAGEHHILPDENTLLVAEVVEILVFVKAASPDAQTVHVGFDRIGEQGVIPGAGVGFGAGIHRDPVSTLGEDIDAVVAEFQADAVFVLLADGLHVAQADPFGKGHAVRRDGERVERLFPVSGRIPELRISHLEIGGNLVFSGSESGVDAPGFAVECKRDRYCSGGEGVDLRGDSHVTAAGGVELFGADVFQPGAGGIFQTNFAVNAAQDQ